MAHSSNQNFSSPDSSSQFKTNQRVGKKSSYTIPTTIKCTNLQFKRNKKQLYFFPTILHKHKQRYDLNQGWPTF
jgi:hypothetical protein